MKTLLLVVLIIFSSSLYSATQYSCKLDAGIKPDNFETNFDLGATWVDLRGKLEETKYFFNYSLFQGTSGLYLQYFLGTVDDNNITTPIVGNSILLSEGQEKISISNFICDSDVPCWTLDCSLKK